MKTVPLTLTSKRTPKMEHPDKITGIFSGILLFGVQCYGEGNGIPLQYSCLENPRDGGAWWAAVYGVAQSRT